MDKTKGRLPHTEEYEVLLRVRIDNPNIHSIEDFTECEIEAFNRANEMTVDVTKVTEIIK